MVADASTSDGTSIHVVSTSGCRRKNIDQFLKDNDLTAKQDIFWRKGLTYYTPNFPNHREDPPNVIQMESPVAFFAKYFTDDLYNRMVQCTNLYAVQNNNIFSPTYTEEMKTFVGMHILIGNISYPRLKCYWQPNLKIPFICESMPQNRFYKLRQNLHFTNNEDGEQNKNDRFWKVRPLFDTIRARLQALTLESHLCIDEQVVPFKGTLSVKQYMKNKPTPWCIKIFALCGTSGQMYDFILYQGSTTELNDNYQAVFGLGGAVVLQLCQRLSNVLNIRLYFDNYFSNYNLLQHLRRKQIYVSCTARQNRFRNPPFSSDAQMKKSGRGTAEELISRDGEIILTKWFDNKGVVMASNYMGIGNISYCRRWDKIQKKYLEIPRPEVVHYYNCHMGGVDKLDFLISIYRTFIKSRKWTLRMFTHAIDLACVNAWIEYRKSAETLGIPKKHIMDLLHFRASIAEALILVDKTVTRKRGRPSNVAEDLPKPKRANIEVRPQKEVRLDNIGHLPVVTEKYSRCKKPACKGKTKYSCCKCKVHLCLDKFKNCFFDYHTQ